MRLATYIVLVAALAFAGACRNAKSVSDAGGNGVPTSARVLLEHEYVNYAWGYSHFGIVITADGSVHGYQWQRSDTPSTMVDGPLVTFAELASKYAHGSSFVGNVSADTLALIEELIPKAAKGKLTERQSVGADMGQHEYIAYMLEARSEQYRKITLRVTGDWEWSNNAPEAHRLADILQAVVRRSK